MTNRELVLAVVASAWGLALGGCGQPPGEIFPARANTPRWPQPPEPIRVRYVGQIATDEDLKPAKKFGEELARAIFGQTPHHAMLSPFAVCTDQHDRLFVADRNGQMVHMFDLNTRDYAQWRPAAPNPKLTQPVALAYDPAGRLIVADSVAAALFIFDATGAFTALMGEGVLQRPCGIAIHPTDRRIFVADAAAHQVVVLSPEGKLLARVGERGDRLGQFNYPTSVALNGQGQLFVSDSLNFRVQQFDADLKPVRQIGSHGDVPGYFARPRGLAFDTEDHLYVVDSQFEAVQIFNDKGEVLLTFGEEGYGPGQFWLPIGIFIDARNRIWVADSYNRRVQVFDFVPEVLP